MAATPRALPTPDEILERERSQKRPATIAGMTAAGLLAAAAILEQVLASSGVPDFDQNDLVQTLGAQAAGQPAPKSFITAVGQFKIDHALETVLIFGLRGLSFLLMIPIILLLLRGARERGGTLARWLEPLTVVGFAVLAIGTLVVGFLEPAFYRDARDAGLTPGAIRDAYEDSPIVYASIPVLIGSLLVCVPVALVSLQAMRVGLLPRVLGFMGVLVGLLFVITADSTGLVRAFWLAAVCWVVAGRLAPSLSPGWATGKAEVPEPRQPPAPREPKKGKGGKPPKLTK